MKKNILALLLAMASFAGAWAQDDGKLFPYPVVPEEKTVLSERCNFLVDHFWDRCNLKQSFSTMAKLNTALGDWFSFMPYATADTVHLAIDRFLADVGKVGPKQVLSIGKMAEGWLYSDTAYYKSEELYMPFCRAVAQNKKVDKAERGRFEAQLRVLENSALGQKAPGFDFIKPDGTTGNFADVIASRIVLFFNDPDCFDCMLAKTRLSADFSTKKLVDAGLVKIVAIYPGEPTEEWKAAVDTYPDNWVVGANPDIDLDFEIGEMPAFYYLDSRHKILGKHLSIDNLILGLNQISQSMGI